MSTYRLILAKDLKDENSTSISMINMEKCSLVLDALNKLLVFFNISML